MKVNKVRLAIVILIMCICATSAIITYHSDAIVKDWAGVNREITTFNRVIVGVVIGGILFPLMVAAVLIILMLIGGMVLAGILDFLIEPTPEEIEDEETDVISPAELKALKIKDSPHGSEPKEVIAKEVIAREALLDFD